MIALAVILIILLAVLLIPIQVSIRLNMTEKEIIFRYLFLKKRLYPTEKKETEKKTEEQKPKEKKDISEMLKFIWEIKDIVFEMLTKILSYIMNRMIKIPILRISGRFGTGDPAYTGMLCGAVYSAVYNVIGNLTNKKILLEHEADIKPDFDNACLDAGMYAEIRTRAVHIIALLFIAMKYLIKIYLQKGKRK